MIARNVISNVYDKNTNINTKDYDIDITSKSRRNVIKASSIKVNVKSDKNRSQKQIRNGKSSNSITGKKTTSKSNKLSHRKDKKNDKRTRGTSDVIPPDEVIQLSTPKVNDV